MALIKCNLCGNKVSSRAKFCPKCKCPTPPKKTAADSAMREPPTNLVQIIDSLEIAPELKELFKLIATSAIKRNILGVRVFASDDLRLKLWNLKDAKHSIVSLLAFSLGPIFYFIKGMWRKGVALSLPFLLSLASFGFFTKMFAIITIISTLFAIMLLSAMMAKYDYYRKIILSERFWW